MKSKEMPARVLIVAAEASSAQYARQLLKKIRVLHGSTEAFGVGSRAMESDGFRCLGYAEDLAVVGLVEVVKHWSAIKTTYQRILEECEKSRPQVAILMDYPGFNLRLAKDLKARGIPVVYFISPQVWAWKQGRVHKIKKFVDRMLCVLPFEPEFYSRFGYKADFVGHPLLDERDSGLLEKEAQALLRSRYGIRPEQRVLGLMPGSRRGEIKHHLEIQLSVAKSLVEQHSDLQVLLLLAPTVEKDEVTALFPSDSPPVKIVQADPFVMIALCDLVLCASGTATLMVGLMEKPMVIMYRAHPVTTWVGRRLMKAPFFGLVNLIAGREMVPERLQEQASERELLNLLDHLLKDPEAYLTMKADLKKLPELLGNVGALDRVAGVVGSYL